MLIDVLTIFPKMFEPVLKESILKRAQNKGLIKIRLHDLRDYSQDKHKKVDDASYGAGGMVFTPQPLFSAVESILGYTVYPKGKKDPNKRIVMFSPQGKRLTQSLSRKYLKYERLILIAPRYEGIDNRVRKHLVEDEISIGDYVLSGGELPAMVFIDSITRLIPGVVSSSASIEKESFENGRLDYPHYTRPQDFRGLKVPSILVSGDHKKIETWRDEKSLEITKRKRPDLLK